MAFVSLLSKSSKQGRTVHISSTKLGTFHLDATTNEQHMAKMRLTDNPIESGSKVTDHAVIEPKEITLTGIVVGYSPPTTLMSSLGKGNVNLEDYPLPAEVQGILSKGESIANRAIAQVKNVKSEAENILSDWVPNIDKNKFDSSSTSDRISTAYDALLTMQASGGFLELTTSAKLYKNMLITSISMTQVNQMSASITITMREVFVVETTIGKGFVVKRNLGKTQPKEVDKSVALKTGEVIEKLIR